MSGYLAALVSVYVFVRGCLVLHPHNAEVISVSFEPSSSKAVFLTNDTELSVAPKTRRPWNSEKQIVNGENPVTKSDPAMTSPTARTPSCTVLLRVLPASMFPDHLPSLPVFGSVIFVSQWMLSVARLEGLLPSDPETTLIADVKRLDPPPEPAGAPNPPPSDAAPIARVLNPVEAKKREVVKEEILEDGHVRVVGTDGVQGGQMIIVGGVAGVEDWDVVRQVLGSGGRNVRTHDCLCRLSVYADLESTQAALDLPPSAVAWVSKMQSVYLLILISRSRRRRYPPAHVLAGVDELLTKCHDFCRRMFALYEAGAVAGRMLAFLLETSCF